VSAGRLKPASTIAHARKLAALQARVAEAEATLHAIQEGNVDAVVVAGSAGPRVFTLEGAEHAYRVLIESMNEGAVTLSGKTILYANACFARMLKCPLEHVTGSPLRGFLSADDDAALRPLLKRTAKSGSKIQVGLRVSDGSILPVQISIRPLARNGFKQKTVGMVVTDMTEARRSENALRGLTRRLLQAQESERGRVALELHDNITQLLCAILVRSQSLADALSPLDDGSRSDALNLRGMIANAADEVQRISRNLRPSVLDQLGLVAGLRSTSKAFGARTGIVVKAVLVKLAARLPADTELTLFRILQEALTNVEKHARARRVTVTLTQDRSIVQLSIQDDGKGFDPDRRSARRGAARGIGLLGMRERATYVGGTLRVKSILRGGTEIEVRVPAAVRSRTRRRETPPAHGETGSERS
jgi:two-component system NarL family sensor kinase